jgi:hypothetical protein
MSAPNGSSRVMYETVTALSSRSRIVSVTNGTAEPITAT